MKTSEIFSKQRAMRDFASHADKMSGGFTLLELLIAVVIGSLVIAAVGGLFLANTNTFRAVDDSSRLQENGRFALQTLARAVHQAGYAPVDVLQLVKDAKDAFPSNLDGVAGATVVAGRDGVGPQNSDTLTVAFRGDSRGQMLDCGGRPNVSPLAVSVAALGPPIESKFYVATANAGASAGFSLWCDVTVNGTRTGRYELITGVESFQVLYGVNSRITAATGAGSSTGSIEADFYTSANKLSGVQFRAIRGLQVALVLRGAERSTLDVARTTNTLNLFGSQADRVTPLYNGTVNADAGAVYTIQPGDQLRTFQVITSNIDLRNGAA